MRHHNAHRTLSRTRRGRVALVRGLALSLLIHGAITTTEAKAKELRPFIERLITRAKTDSIAARRIVASRLGEPANTVIQKLFSEIAPKYAERNGGYTRVVKMGETPAGRREAVIELV